MTREAGSRLERVSCSNCQQTEPAEKSHGEKPEKKNRPQIDPKSTPNRPQNRPQIDPKSTPNRPKIDPKSTNRPKIDPKSTQNRPEIDPKSTQNRPRNRPKIDPKSTPIFSTVAEARKTQPHPAQNHSQTFAFTRVHWACVAVNSETRTWHRGWAASVERGATTSTGAQPNLVARPVQTPRATLQERFFRWCLKKSTQNRPPPPKKNTKIEVSSKPLCRKVQTLQH